MTRRGSAPVAGDARSDQRVEPLLDGSDVGVAIVCARFNDLVTLRLLEGARRGLRTAGVPDANVSVAWVPGAFELPLAAKAHAEQGADAVVCLGAVIRGETTHYDLVAGESARGIQRVQLETGVPVMFGVLTTEDLAQALARSEGPGEHNVGEECGLGAVEMVGLLRALKARMD
ncbi:MAG TPA: 6,7-dimethyl-8-ribityllumazine synthase [Acidimicrobiales bacterium]